jgi:hypothetical protein
LSRITAITVIYLPKGWVLPVAYLSLGLRV